MANNITIENARMIFKNFSGKESRFNRAGTRNFAVVIDDEEWAQKLRSEGWNIKELKKRNPSDKQEYQLPVSVRFDNYPPKIVMISSAGRTNIDAESASILDYADIASVDMVISPSKYDFNGNTGLKAYLKTMYVVLEENELDLKYAEHPATVEDEPALPF